MKIIIYQSNLCQYGGVETFLYNWCWWLRNFFDVSVLYCSGDATRIKKMSKIVEMIKYDEHETYVCDVFIRNSVWGLIPQNIKAKRMIEMRHANYKFLLDKGWLYQQYKDMGIKEIVGCGEFVSKMSDEVLHDHPTTIKNILLPRKKTNKILHFISCTRIDANKGWNRMLELARMLKREHIKFDWKVFTNATQYKSPFDEIRFYKPTYDIWDDLADADYTILLSDSEGLPYTIQESLLYQVPCIVTDVGGCTELIKDGVNGYVVPLDMKFDVKKLLNIPKCKEYDNHALEDWLKYLGYKGKIDKQAIINNIEEEEKSNMVRAKVIQSFTLGAFDEIEGTLVRANEKNNVDGKLFVGDIFDCTEEMARYLCGDNPKGMVVIEVIETIKQKEEKKEPIKEEHKEEKPKTKKSKK